jgi:hypothetical protein
VCFKGGHTTLECWYKFDESYTPATKTASAAMNNYCVDSNWYTDTGATDHITGELNKLAVHDVYNGVDQIKTASGAGMTIVDAKRAPGAKHTASRTKLASHAQRVTRRASQFFLKINKR